MELKVVRTLFLVYNILLLVLGSFLLFFGIGTSRVTHLNSKKSSDYKIITDDLVVKDFFKIDAIVIIAGVLNIFAGLVGLYGTLRKSSDALVFDIFIFIFLGVLVLISLVILPIVFGILNLAMHNNMARTFKDQGEDQVQAYDNVHGSLGCCAVDGPGDYSKEGISGPAKSCCGGGGDNCTESDGNSLGCYAALRHIMWTDCFWLMMGNLMALPIVVLGGALAWWLAMEVLKKDGKWTGWRHFVGWPIWRTCQWPRRPKEREKPPTLPRPNTRGPD